MTLFRPHARNAVVPPQLVDLGTDLRRGPAWGWSCVELSTELRRHLLAPCATARSVSAIEHLRPDGETAYVELGMLEQIDGAMWCVAGIYEPASPDDPWWLVHARRRGPALAVRRPFTQAPQASVVRVHDAVDRPPAVPGRTP